jgi:hypothetical protein
MLYSCETMEYYPSFRTAMFHPEVDTYALLTRLPLSRQRRDRSTCMPKARRQRSSWTRIKSSKKNLTSPNDLSNLKFLPLPDRGTMFREKSANKSPREPCTNSTEKANGKIRRIDLLINYSFNKKRSKMS